MPRPATTVRALAVLVAASALLCIRAQLVGDAAHVYLFKPLAIGGCLAAAWLAAPTPTPRYRGWLLAGLAWSALGDVLLMLPRDLFAAGLGAFFVAHLCYIRAFVSAPPGRIRDLRPLAALLPVALGVAAVIWPGVPRPLQVPVLCYLAVIVIMAWQAIGRAIAGPGTDTKSAAAGAALFVVSDGALAINRFATPFDWAPVVVLGTYFAAQWLLARSAGRATVTA